MKKLFIIFFLLWASVAHGQTITSITYYTDRHPTCTVSSPCPITPIPTPPATAWTSPAITLLPGINHVTITVTNSNAASVTASRAITYTPTFPGNALVGAYAFKDGSGTTAVDSTANANNATLVNGAVFTPQGKFDSGVTFNSALGSYVNVPDQNYNDFTQGFTISAQVKPTASSGWRTVAAKDQAVNAANFPVQFLYSYQPGGTSGCNAGEVEAGFIANGVLGPVQIICSTGPLATGSYSHVAVTYDGANLRLYINGVLNRTQAATGIMEPSAYAWQIGNDRWEDAFAGDIDEVRFYNYAIPLTGGANTTPNAACVFADNTTTPSIVGNMNCNIIPGTPPLTVKFPASATGLRVGAGTSLKFGQP